MKDWLTPYEVGELERPGMGMDLVSFMAVYAISHITAAVCAGFVGWHWRDERRRAYAWLALGIVLESFALLWILIAAISDWR